MTVSHDQIVAMAKRVFSMEALSVPMILNVDRRVYRMIAGEKARHAAQMVYEASCGIYGGRRFDRRRWKRIGRHAYEAEMRALDEAA